MRDVFWCVASNEWHLVRPKFWIKSRQLHYNVGFRVNLEKLSNLKYAFLCLLTIVKQILLIVSLWLACGRHEPLQGKARCKGDAGSEVHHQSRDCEPSYILKNMIGWGFIQVNKLEISERNDAEQQDM